MCKDASVPDLQARLHAAVSTVYRRWAVDMPLGVGLSRLDWRPLSSRDGDGAVRDVRPPLWDGAVYQRLARTWRRCAADLCGQIERVITEAAEPPDSEERVVQVYGALYALRVAMVEIRTDWHSCSGYVSELSTCVDAALRSLLDDDESPEARERWTRWSDTGPIRMGQRGPDRGSALDSAALVSALHAVEGAPTALADELARHLTLLVTSARASADAIEALSRLDHADAQADDLADLRCILARAEVGMARTVLRTLGSEALLTRLIASFCIS